MFCGFSGEGPTGAARVGGHRAGVLCGNFARGGCGGRDGAAGFAGATDKGFEFFAEFGGGFLGEGADGAEEVVVGGDDFAFGGGEGVIGEVFASALGALAGVGSCRGDGAEGVAEALEGVAHGFAASGGYFVVDGLGGAAEGIVDEFADIACAEVAIAHGADGHIADALAGVVGRFAAGGHAIFLVSETVSVESIHAQSTRCVYHEKGVTRENAKSCEIFL